MSLFIALERNERGNVSKTGLEGNRGILCPVNEVCFVGTSCVNIGNIV